MLESVRDRTGVRIINGVRVSNILCFVTLAARRSPHPSQARILPITGSIQLRKR